MAVTSVDSFFSAPFLRRRAWWGAAMFATFMLYCEGYSLIGEDVVSPLVSARWALAATASWGCLLLLLHSNRQRMRGWAAGIWRGKLSLLAALTLVFVLADQLSLQLTALLAGHESTHEVAARLYAFSPRALMLGAIVLLALLLLERRFQASAPAIAPPVATADWLAFPESPMLRLRVSDVSRVRSAGNYSELVTGGRGHLVRVPLSDLAQRLAPLGFMRVHRQIIVNGSHVREICRGANGRAVICMADGERIVAGRRYRDAVKLGVETPDIDSDSRF